MHIFGIDTQYPLLIPYVPIQQAFGLQLYRDFNQRQRFAVEVFALMIWIIFVSTGESRFGSRETSLEATFRIADMEDGVKQLVVALENRDSASKKLRNVQDGAKDSRTPSTSSREPHISEHDRVLAQAALAGILA